MRIDTRVRGRGAGAECVSGQAAASSMASSKRSCRSAATRSLNADSAGRLTRPSGEVIPAGRFMPALDRMGAAGEADIAVLNMAAETLAVDAGARVSVNLSAAGLGRAGWRGAFLEMADRSPDLAERLIVEISEDAALSDIGAASELFMQLRVRGVSLALDDFGAGRTSFQHLRDFRFDMLKIDGGFIKGIDASPDNQMLVTALAGIGRQFDMMVIAEFVETAQEARTLRKIGVDGFQGAASAGDHVFHNHDALPCANGTFDLPSHPMPFGLFADHEPLER